MRFSVSFRGRPFEIEAPTHDHISRPLAKGTFYDAASIEKMVRLIEGSGYKVGGRVRGGRIIDAGAHVGNHAVPLSAALGWPVLAFEPYASSFAYLARNLAANALVPHGVTAGSQAIQVSLGAAPHWARVDDTLARIERNTGMVRCRPIDTAQPFPFDAIVGMPIDAFRVPDVRLIKIDVEGVESAVLQGAVGTLARCSPVIWAEAQDGPEELDDFFGDLSLSAGFKTLRYRRIEGPWASSRNGTPSWVWGPEEA